MVLEREQVNRIAVVLLVIVAVTLVAVYLGMNLERKSIRVYVGATGEARRNHLLAAERLLTRYGAKVQRGNSARLLRNPSGISGLILVHGTSASLNKAEQHRLRQWISGGGHLIYDAGAAWEKGAERFHDGFLAEFGISAERGFWASNNVRVELYGDEPLRAKLSSRLLLKDERGVADLGIPHPNEPGHYVLSLEVGAGRLTVLAGSGFLNNSNIGEADNAALLLAMVDGERRIWVLRDKAGPGLLSRLWGWAPQLISVLLVLLLLELWRRGFRIGPLQAIGERGSRDLSAHFRAHAGYLWRHQLSALLLAQRRERLWQHWEARHPVLRDMNSAQRLDWLSERSGIGRASLAAALAPDQVSAREADFLSSSQIMQRLWRMA